MKITIEHESTVCTVENSDIITWVDALPLLEQALRGVGYNFKGELDIINEDINDNDNENR